jgi:hypothetical protein
LQFGGASCEDLLMNAYSKDLRMKALHAVDRGTPRKKKEVVRTFGVSLAATERDEKARGAWRERLSGIDPARLVFVDESSTNIALSPRYGRAPKGERAFGKAPRNWGKNVTL